MFNHLLNCLIYGDMFPQTLGGHAHGPKPKSYDYTLPKKVRRMGVRTALSVRYAQVRFAVIL